LERLLQESSNEAVHVNENGKRTGPEAGQFDDVDVDDEFQR
jgi:hypothetical protein